MFLDKLKTKLKFTYNRIVIYFVKLAIKNNILESNRASVEYYKPKSKKFIVISNHTDVLDPAYVTIALDRYIRFVAGDNTIRHKQGWMYKYLAGVIIKHKEKPSSVLTDEIKHDVALGVPVGLFAEGAVTVNGQTCFVSPNTGKLIKDSGAALITYKFTGGYLKCPRWAKKNRKGPIKGHFVHEYSAEELSKLSEDEVNAIIERDIYVNAYDEQKKNPEKYPGEDLAEAAERIVYICPKCKQACKLHSKGNYLACDCGYKLEMKDDGFFHDCGSGVIFDNMLEWDLWQREELKKRVLAAAPGSLIFSDEHQSVSRITDTTKTEMLSYDAVLSLYTDKIKIELGPDKENIEFALDDIKTVTFSGKDSVIIIHGNTSYDIRCKVPRSSIKYMAAWRYLTGKEYK